MLTELENTKRALAGKHRAIDDWLDARQALLVEYMRLAGLMPTKSKQRSLPFPVTSSCNASANSWSTTSAPAISRSTTTW